MVERVVEWEERVSPCSFVRHLAPCSAQNAGSLTVERLPRTSLMPSLERLNFFDWWPTSRFLPLFNGVPS